MSDYTPTEGDVRQRYMGHNGSDWSRPEQGEFDRWLAAHDAEVAAKALRDAADSVKESSGVISVQSVHRALRDRADRIEAFDD